MSTRDQPSPITPTGELPAVEVCGCADDVHRWTAPVVETIDTVGITRWRCTCGHCQCDALHLTVYPSDTGKPQHTQVSADEPSSGFLYRAMAGLDRL